MLTVWNSIRALKHRLPSRWWLASLTFHALILTILMFFTDPHPRGRGRLGLAQDGAFSVTWIPGDGGGGAGKGEIDTVLPGDETGNPQETITTDPTASSPKTSLLNITETDPQSIFRPEEETPLEVSPNDSAVLTVETEAGSNPRQSSPTTHAKTDKAPQKPTDSRLSSVSHSTTENSTTDDSASNGGGRPKSLGGNGAGSGDDGPSGSGGGRVRFFGILARAKRIVYVIDASESMRKHNAMAIAQKELIQSLKNLDPSTYFQVVFFDLKTHAMKSPPGREKLLRANPSNLHQAESFIKGIVPEAGTDRFLAVSEALKFDPDAIFLLTDADEPEISAKELWDIQRANKRKAAIHVVEFGIGADLSRDSFLKKLTRPNGGRHRYHDLTKIEE